MTAAREERLRALPLFSALSPEQFARVMASSREFSPASRDSLFKEGEACRRFFYLDKGLVKLFRVSVDGTEKVVRLITPGMVFAEAVMFMEESQYPVSAETLQPSRIIAFDNRAFLSLLRESPQTCFRMMAGLSQRLQFWLQEVDTICLQSATRRLINFLLDRLAEKPAGQPLVVELSVPKSVLASRLSIQPETFSRLLNNLRRQGVIRVSNRTIEILDLVALEEQRPECPRSAPRKPPPQRLPAGPAAAGGGN